MGTEVRKFQLQCEPAGKLSFTRDAASGAVRAKLKITNKSDTRQAFKVKCTRNDLFKIRPSMGLLEYREEAIVEIEYRPKEGEVPDEERQHFGVYHIPAPEGCTAEGAWMEHYGQPQGDTRLRVRFDVPKVAFEGKE
ncbi:unnamed protein product, partial [Mesorhabditis spiculigera]